MGGLREAPWVERFMGLEVYATASRGIGGRIRERLEDFVVHEVLINGLCTEDVLGMGREPGEGLAGRGSFLLCVLVKQGMDTLEAVARLVKTLSVPAGLVGFAGLKDAKAVTAQFITVRGLRPECLADLKPVLSPALDLRPVRYMAEPLGPGHLAANRFEVTVRRLGPDERIILAALEDLLAELKKLSGLPNFYGHQRFGTARPVTHLVGRELVKGDVRKAVEAFLTFIGPGESPATREARAYLAETGDLRGFLAHLPKGLYYERLLTRHLLRRPGDYHGAMRKLPLRLRRLFVHAYQAYLFNRFLSARLREGMPLHEPLPGDWVVRLDKWGRPTGRPLKADTANLAALRGRVKEGKAAVALPLPGFRQELSGGRQGELEEAIMEQEGMDRESFKLKIMPELASPGWLRPAAVEVELLRPAEVEEDRLNPGFRALRFSFQLPRGSYATVFLRELMKPEDPLAAGF